MSDEPVVIGTGVPHGTDRILAMIASEQWAITDDALGAIVTIARRENESPEAVAAKLGRPLLNARKVEMRGSVAIIPVAGPIFPRANLMTELSGATSIEMLALDFNKALESSDVEAVILDHRSPGGAVFGVNEFQNMIYEARGIKPIVSYVGEQSSSADYWIASAADKVVVDATALLGSIGVVSSVKINKADDTVEIVSSQSPHKRHDIQSEEGMAQRQTLADDLASIFIETVARNRGVSTDTVLSDFGQGGVFVGEKAIEAGLADELGSLESLIAGLTGSSKGVISMSDDKANQPEITRELIAAEHPAIAAAFREEGAASAREGVLTEGATAERERIQGVFEQGKLMPGHDALVEDAMFDGKTSGPESAVKLLAANSTSVAAAAKAIEDDAKEAAVDQVDGTGADAAAADKNLPLKERAQKSWDASADLQKEFAGNFETYLAHCELEEKQEGK